MENGFWCRSHLEHDIIMSRHVDENTYVPTYALQIHKQGGTVINARRGLYHVCSVLDNIIYTQHDVYSTLRDIHKDQPGQDQEVVCNSIRSQWV